MLSISCFLDERVSMTGVSSMIGRAFFYRRNDFQHLSNSWRCQPPAELPHSHPEDQANKVLLW